MKRGEKMARKKGQTYSGDKKAKIVLEMLKEEKTLSQLSSEYKVSVKTLNIYKKGFFENLSRIFESDKKQEEELVKLKSENEILAKTLGKTVVERDWAVGKLVSLDWSSKKELVVFKHNSISITRQAELLNINRSSLYYKPKELSDENLKILNQIDEIYTNNPEYGYRMIHQQLLENGYNIGKDRVLKYMRVLCIQALYPKKKKMTSIKDKEHKTYKYLLQSYWYKTGKTTKAVNVDTPNEVWSADITYIRMNGGFVYLSAIIDWNTRAILAYKISNSMDVTLATDTLKMALEKYPSPKIFNTDQGSQYTSNTHIQILKDNNIQISMNGKGRTIDNIIIERFFRTLKQGHIYISDYQTIKELKRGVQEYIFKYNFKRFHSSLDYKKPMNVYLDFIKKMA